MSTTATRPGIVHDGGGLTLFDLRELPWEPHIGIPGGRQKTLSQAPDGTSLIQVTWIPAGYKGAGRPKRHFHSTVHERGIVLFGDLPMREYLSPDDDHGRPVVFREGYFMDRKPGSVHGIDPDRTSDVGFVMLEWRTGPGTFLTEPGAEQETVVLEASPEASDRPLAPDGSPPWIIADSGGLKLIDTRAMPWEPLQGIAGAQMQALTRSPEGWTECVILHMLPRALGGEPHRHYHSTVHEFGYALDGELPMREYASVADDIGQRVLFREGYFMDRRPGSIHGIDTSRVSPTGYTFLEWRNGPGTYLREPGMERETIVMPAAEIPA